MDEKVILNNDFEGTYNPHKFKRALWTSAGAELNVLMTWQNVLNSYNSKHRYNESKLKLELSKVFNKELNIKQRNCLHPW